MSDPEKLTPAEEAELEGLKRRHAAQSASVEFADALPGFGKYLGPVGGRFVAYAKGIGVILTILLIPKHAEEAFTYYKPKVEAVYAMLSSEVSRLQQDGVDPDSVPYSPMYAILDPVVPTTTTTTTTQPPGPRPGVTVVSSTGISPSIISGSGVVPPPSTLG
jgi:hypothetical protein